MHYFIETRVGDQPAESIHYTSYSDAYPDYLKLRSAARHATFTDGIPRKVRLVIECERFDALPEPAGVYVGAVA